MKEVGRRLISLCRPFFGIIAVIILMIAAERAVGLVIPYFTGRLVDALIHQSGRAAMVSIIIIAVVRTFDNILETARWKTSAKKLIGPLHGHLLKVVLNHLCSLSISQHRAEHSGIKSDIVGKGQSAVSSLLHTLMYSLIPMVAEMAFVLCMLLNADRRIGGIFLIGSLVFAIWSIKLNRHLAAQLVDLQQTQRTESKVRGELLTNIPLVITCGQERRAVDESEESRRRSYGHYLRVWVPYMQKATARDMVLILTRMAISAMGVWLVMYGELSVGQAVTIWALSNSALSEVQGIGPLWRDILEDLTSFLKFIEILDIRPQVKIAPNAIRPERFRGAIQFQNVTMAYSSKETSDSSVLPSLRGVSLTITPGQRVAIIGRSGAGKSTLVHAILRGQEPDSGSITVDGHNLRSLDPVHWRRHLGVVPQTPYLFDRSIRYNITFGMNGKATDVTNSDLERICTMASLDDVLERLPNGFETVIGERGIRLSGGEQQRLGIARALITDPDILILDEATSNLDPENEDHIVKAIRTAAKGRTTIVVAHRFSTIRDADLVVVMDEGQIKDTGTHQELSERSSIYQRLVHHQIAGILVNA